MDYLYCYICGNKVKEEKATIERVENYNVFRVYCKTCARRIEIVLLSDKQWKMIDGEPCRVIAFNEEISRIGKVMPYATISIECKKVNQKLQGCIANKTDCKHLKKAFKERDIKENTEVIIFWTERNYKFKFLRIFSNFLPKLWVMVCKKGAFNLMSDSNNKPELQGEARFLAEMPIIEWKPEIMD